MKNVDTELEVVRMIFEVLSSVDKEPRKRMAYVLSNLLDQKNDEIKNSLK